MKNYPLRENKKEGYLSFERQYLKKHLAKRIIMQKYMELQKEQKQIVGKNNNINEQTPQQVL